MSSQVCLFHYISATRACRYVRLYSSRFPFLLIELLGNARAITAVRNKTRLNISNTNDTTKSKIDTIKSHHEGHTRGTGCPTAEFPQLSQGAILHPCNPSQTVLPIFKMNPITPAFVMRPDILNTVQSNGRDANLFKKADLDM